jgi:hypothetical protein
MNPEEARIRRTLRDDFEAYARKCLKIRTKEGGIKPLVLNSAQRYIHERLEEQKAETGRVRAIILKGRQQGSSTYVEARFYHQTSHRKGTRAFILTHEDEATKNIFEMVERYHEHCPDLVKPSTGAANAKELFFDTLDSGYRVGTARTKGVGRSGTVQLFHGSESGFWPHADTHVAGVMQSIPGGPGTEVILESTSAGPAGFFHSTWEAAERGESDFIPIFVPWFWQDEYRANASGFVPTAEERAYGDLHELDAEQLAWRRAKIIELNGIWHFRREYPATPEEAWNAENPGALWTRELIEETRVTEAPASRMMAIALDPATTSTKTSDEWGIIWGSKGTNGHVYIWGDETQKARPGAAIAVAVGVYREHEMERFVAESNQGGEMIEDLVEIEDRTVNVTLVHASRGKRARAEPVQALYAKGKVHHVGTLPALEDEMCMWDADRSNESPNRIDALTWLVTELLLKGRDDEVVAPHVEPLGRRPYDI